MNDPNSLKRIASNELDMGGGGAACWTHEGPDEVTFGAMFVSGIVITQKEQYICSGGLGWQRIERVH
eukprot:1394760-Rhodomonas_salina.1